MYSSKQPVVPRSRYGHSVCYYDGKVYMYGGRNDEDGCFNAVVSYDIGKQWYIVLCRLHNDSS